MENSIETHDTSAIPVDASVSKEVPRAVLEELGQGDCLNKHSTEPIASPVQESHPDGINDLEPVPESSDAISEETQSTTATSETCPSDLGISLGQIPSSSDVLSSVNEDLAENLIDDALEPLTTTDNDALEPLTTKDNGDASELQTTTDNVDALEHLTATDNVDASELLTATDSVDASELLTATANDAPVEPSLPCDLVAAVDDSITETSAAVKDEHSEDECHLKPTEDNDLTSDLQNVSDDTGTTSELIGEKSSISDAADSKISEEPRVDEDQLLEDAPLEQKDTSQDASSTNIIEEDELLKDAPQDDDADGFNANEETQLSTDNVATNLTENSAPLTEPTEDLDISEENELLKDDSVDGIAVNVLDKKEVPECRADKPASPEIAQLGDDSQEAEVSKAMSDVQGDVEAGTSEDERTKGPEETAMEVDDDQEMQDFLDVSTTNKDKDLEDPVTVDTSDELMEIASQTEEDPIGLSDEPEVVACEELMDVDDTSDKDKTSDLADDVLPSSELAGEDDSNLDVSAESSQVVNASKNDSQEPVDALAGGSQATADTSEVAESTADPAVVTLDDDVLANAADEEPSVDSAESPMDTTDAAVKTSEAATETAESAVNTSDSAIAIPDAQVKSADANTSSQDLPTDGADDGDEEICIIPDTFRVLPPATDAAAADKPVGPSKGIKLVDAGSLTKDVTAKDVATEEPAGHSRPQRRAAKKAESQIKAMAEGSKKDSLRDDLDGVSAKTLRPDEVASVDPTVQMCFQCCRVTLCSYEVYVGAKRKSICDVNCRNLFLAERVDNEPKPTEISNVIVTDDGFTRKCAQCLGAVTGDDRNLSWETMDYCNEECLSKYQNTLGSHCANCKGGVASASMGKYCVRFGYYIRQFCCSGCLEEFKKGLKVCSYCQLDISNNTEGFLAPVGDKGQFKDFCSQKCMEKYDSMSNNLPPATLTHECDVCRNAKVVQVRVLIGAKKHLLCSEPCFAAFKFVNKIDKAEQCEMCKKYVDKMKTEMSSVFYNDALHSFCSKMCMNVYILANRKIVPCNWCKVKKYNFDMIKRVMASGQAIMMCSLTCMTLYLVSVNAISSRKIKCDHCKKISQAQYHLTMSDATIRNFCAYNCVMTFQSQYSKNPPLTLPPGTDAPVIPTGQPKRSSVVPRRSLPQNENQAGTNAMPVITAVHSLAPPNGQQVQPNSRLQAALKVQTNNANLQPAKPPQVVYKQQVIVKPPAPKEQRNKSVGCRPIMVNKSVSCRPTHSTRETQTDESLGRPVFIPIPVPIYVPAPMHMYSMPFPMPVPFPLPIPVPMFIPTTRNSIRGILKEMKRIQEKIPNDPFEAELLMMAEMVAGEKKGDGSDSDSDDGDNGAGDVSEVPEASSLTEAFSPEAVDTSNFGEDMLQMALKMASEYVEPAVDLEETLTPSTITAQSSTSIEQTDATESEVDDPEPVMVPVERSQRGRKRGASTQRRGSTGSPNKRGRRSSSLGGDVPLLPPPEPTAPIRMEVEKPDANMCLKYTLGVSAWRQWVKEKNAELEKASNNRKLKLFKPEILQLTSDELNYSLCLFVKEVRKPNGTEYAPDTIYYLVLGIQQYLFENNRIDNIFTDAYYEKFTECLDEVAKRFSVIYNDAKFIVTRVEEEHLWESKQLGAHSPHVLLSTLMFFNTKHFNLTTVEEHMQLSFSHIMKHWKRNPNQPGATKVPGSRNVLLRFYPPQASLEANSRKKKVYEQQENEENPLRCPVKLYEFYLSKCPESVKTRNDVFYLLPERSCVPDSPVWYSTMALGKDPLMKMLHRVKMVKEINIALITS